MTNIIYFINNSQITVYHIRLDMQTSYKTSIIFQTVQLKWAFKVCSRLSRNELTRTPQFYRQ